MRHLKSYVHILSRSSFLNSFSKTTRLSLSTNGRSCLNVIEDDKKKTATVVMQRPPVNSLNYEMLQEITTTIKTLEKKKFRGMILASNSPTVFSAGLDISEMYNPSEDSLKKFWIALQTMWKTLYLTPLVTIAAINGNSPAGGCILSTSCDQAIMVKSRASIGLNETMLGLVAPKWTRDMFISAIGFGRAEFALKQGKLFSSEEALKIGLVHELVDSPADVLSKAQGEMEKWLKIPGVAFQATKLSLRKAAVEKMESYEKQEVIDTLNFILSDDIQKVLGFYYESLRAKKK